MNGLAVEHCMIFKDNTKLLGVADVTLPDLERVTSEIKGFGIGGTVNMPLAGNYSAMTTTINFIAPSKEQEEMFSYETKNIEARAAVRGRDDSGALGTVSIKYVLQLIPNKLTSGKLANGDKADASGEYATTYFAKFVDGVKVTEIDPFNMIAIVNGVDEMAEVRKALGL